MSLPIGDQVQEGAYQVVPASLRVGLAVEAHRVCETLEAGVRVGGRRTGYQWFPQFSP